MAADAQQRLRLLLIEDNPGDAELAIDGLRELPGHAIEVDVVARLADALEALEEGSFNAVILDLNLPDSTGVETLSRLRTRGHDPVVVFSGEADQALRERALALGARDFIGKDDPVPHTLARSVLHALSEARAEKTHQRFERLIAALPDAIIVTDTSDTILFVNQAAVELFAVAREELIGESLGFSVVEGEVSQIQLVRGHEYRFAEMRIAEVDWEGQKAFLASIRDITERQLMEEKLRRAQKMEAIGQLTGGVAHDFNNLLQVIISSAQMLTTAGLPVGAQQHTALILRASERASELTHRLLAFARQQPLQPVPVDIDALIVDVAALVERVLGGTIDFSTRLAPDLPPAWGDPAQLEAAIVNLCVNARDAMPEGGRLLIETSEVMIDEATHDRLEDIRPGRYVQIAVSDTGSGMSPAMIRRAFDPFFTTKAPGEGTGLGLSMVYGLMRQLDGHARISSAEGRGTTVGLFLPVSPSVPREPPAAGCEGRMGDDAPEDPRPRGPA